MDGNTPSNISSKANTYLLIGCVILFCILATIIISAFHIIVLSFGSSSEIIKSLINTNNTVYQVNTSYVGTITEISESKLSIKNGTSTTTFTLNPDVLLGTLPIASKQLTQLKGLNPSQDLHMNDYIQVDTFTKGTTINKVTVIFHASPVNKN